MLPTEDTIPTRDAGILKYTYPASLNSHSRSPRHWCAKGGVELFDGTKGINTTNWIFYAWEYGIWVAKGTEPKFNLGNLILEIPTKGILTLSGAFDRLMAYSIVWVEEDGAYFRWYDTQAEDYVVTHLPGVQSAMLVHDDVRDSSDTTSDIIFSWVENGRIYYAIQRERYTIAREVEVEFPGQVIELKNVGMTGGYRLQWEYTYGST